MKEMSEQSSYHSSSTSSPLRFLIWGCLNWRERCDNYITDFKAIPTLLLHDMCTHISEERRHIPHIIHLLRLPSEFLRHFHFHKDECRKSEANRIHKQVFICSLCNYWNCCPSAVIVPEKLTPAVQFIIGCWSPSVPNLLIRGELAYTTYKVRLMSGWRSREAPRVFSWWSAQTHSLTIRIVWPMNWTNGKGDTQSLFPILHIHLSSPH